MSTHLDKAPKKDQIANIKHSICFTKYETFVAMELVHVECLSRNKAREIFFGQQYVRDAHYVVSL